MDSMLISGLSLYFQHLASYSVSCSSFSKRHYRNYIFWVFACLKTSCLFTWTVWLDITFLHHAFCPCGLNRSCSTVFWHWTFQRRIWEPTGIFFLVIFIPLFCSYLKTFCSSIILLECTSMLTVLCKFFLAHDVPCQIYRFKSAFVSEWFLWKASVNIILHYLSFIFQGQLFPFIPVPHLTLALYSFLDMWLISISFCPFFLNFTIHKVPYCVFQKGLFSFFLLPIYPSLTTFLFHLFLSSFN